MPARIIDKLLRDDVKIFVVPWKRIGKIRLELLIDAAFRNRSNCDYDLNRPMRRANS